MYIKYYTYESNCVFIHQHYIVTQRWRVYAARAREAANERVHGVRTGDA